MNTVDYETIEYIKNLIQQFLTTAGFRSRVEYEQSLTRGLVFNLNVDSPKLLIGKQGITLQALEQLLFAMVNKHFREQEQPPRFIIDIDGYRSEREYQLKQQVKDAVSQLKHSQTPITLPAMSRQERKFIHTYIQEQFPHLTTESVGEEPNRKIIMKI